MGLFYFITCTSFQRVSESCRLQGGGGGAQMLGLVQGRIIVEKPDPT